MGTNHLLAALYLLTNPHANNYGLYYLPLRTMIAETGIRSLRPVLAEVAATGFAEVASDWAYVKKMLRYQMGGLQDTDNRVKGAAAWYQAIPASCPFLSAFWDDYSGVLPLGARRGSVAPESAGSGTLFPVAAGAPVTTALTVIDTQRMLFDRWWLHYPKKVAKRAAWEQWLKLKPTPADCDRWIQVLDAQCLSRDWLKDGGQYIPDPERYLKRGRYEDEISERPIVDDKQTGNFMALRDFIHERSSDVRDSDGDTRRRLRQDTQQAEAGPVLGPPKGHQ